jgi:hypothetical protein
MLCAHHLEVRIMKAQSAALAIAALVLWLIPSGSLAQGNSGKSRLTICHLPPGNPDAGHTMTVSEQAWRAHESHGDYLGPCEGSGDEYGDDKKRAKKGKKGKKKGGKKARSGSDGDDADDDIEVDDRADEGDEVDEADTRTRRTKRQAERRARREQSVRDGTAADDGEAEEGATSGDAEEAEAGGADAGTDDTPAAQRRARRKAAADRRAATSGDAEEAEAGGADTGTDDTPAAQRRARRKAAADRRAAQATQPDAETEDPPEEEQGFFRGMRQFFGFGGDEGEESSGEAVE